MKVDTIKVNAAEVLSASTVTVEIVVTGMWLVKLRFWLALQLVRLASLVSGATIEPARPVEDMRAALGFERGTVPAGYPLTADVDDPGFSFEPFRLVTIFLDGAEVEDCSAYDVPGCWVRCAVRGEGGGIELDESCERVLEERRYGRVDLKLKALETT